MSNILNFPRPKARRSQAQSTAFETIPGIAAPVTTLRVLDTVIPPNPTLPPAETLETALDEYRSTQLELAHRREAFELQMYVEQCTAQIRLEASAYKALVAGVPESDIYSLGEDMAEALSSAMDTVAGA